MLYDKDTFAYDRVNPGVLAYKPEAGASMSGSRNIMQALASERIVYPLKRNYSTVAGVLLESIMTIFDGLNNELYC